MGAALSFSVIFPFFVCELAQKHVLKIILLLAAELALSFFNDNQQIKDHAGELPGSLCPHSFFLNRKAEHREFCNA